jgi:hypothetical protein
MPLSKEAQAFLAKVKAAEPNRPRLAAHVARELLDYAPILDRLNERECSDPSYGGRERAKEARIMKRLQEEIALLNEGRPADSRWALDQNGDPRGYPLYLHFPDRQQYNTMGGRETGWGVPCRGSR